MIYWELFVSFFQIGLFSVGGGYAALPLIQAQVVERHGWLTMAEFADVLTISQMTPGPIALNSATFVGQQVAGFPGAVVCTIACVLAPCMITLALARIYFRYRKLSVAQSIMQVLRPAVVALIASAGMSVLVLALFSGQSVLLQHLDIAAAGIFVVGIIVLWRFKPNPVYVMLASGFLGILCYRAFPVVSSSLA